MSVYVPLKHVKTTSDKPVKLNSEQQKRFLPYVPYTPSPDLDTREAVRQSELEYVKEILDEEEICPSQVNVLGEQILKYAQNSLLVPGDMVGMATSESTSSVDTQNTLNAFHSAGSKSGSIGMVNIRSDITSATKNPKNKILSIYFEDKSLSYEDVLDQRIRLSQVFVSDFIEDHKIFDNAGENTKRASENDVKGWWSESSTDTKIFLRLYLNIAEMYKHRVTIYNLAEKIKSGEEGILVLHGGIQDGVIDIYPIKFEIPTDLQGVEIPRKLAEETYLIDNVMATFEHIIVKGIRDVSDIHPKNIEIGKMLISSVRVKERWYIKFNKVLASHEGLNKQEYFSIFEKIGCKVEDVEEPDRFYVELPDDEKYKTSNGEKVIVRNDQKYRLTKDYIRYKKHYYESVPRETSGSVSIEKGYYLKVQNPYLEDEKLYDLTTNVLFVSPFDYLNRQKVNLRYAIGRGDNLRELLGTPGIDSRRTICSNMHTILSVLGIEAARLFAIKNFYISVMESGASINPTNIIMLPTIMMCKGIPLGARHAGNARQGVGFLSLATNEKAGQLTSAAVYEKFESTNATSVALTLGEYGKYGTHFFDISQVSKGVTLINEDIFEYKGTRNFEVLEDFEEEEDDIEADTEIDTTEIEIGNEMIRVENDPNSYENEVREMLVADQIPNDIIHKSSVLKEKTVKEVINSEPITSPAYDPWVLY